MGCSAFEYYLICIGDPEGGGGALGPIFFHFHAVFGRKIGQNNMMAP